MEEFELGPLALALIVSILSSVLLVLHRRGGPNWLLATGGFLFILGRLMIAAICAFLLFALSEMLLRPDPERQLLAAMFGVVFAVVGGWSIFVVMRVVMRDAFGAARAVDDR